MKKTSQKGFSLIELLLVVTIIGSIAAIGVPYLKKAKYAAENASMYATMRTLASTELSFYSNNNRYATLTEISSSNPSMFGTLTGTTLKRGSFTIDMAVTNPADPSLKSNFTITATKTIDASDLPYQIAVSGDGRIVQLLP
ncbi:MAG: type IV pilin protein [Pyrinomonadaceae bacterium]